MQVKIYLGHESWAGVYQVLEGERDDVRYADIFGPDLKYIMPAMKWKFKPNPNNVGILIFDDEMNIAAATATLNLISHNTDVGCNLSYAVKKDYEGRGLAKIASAICIHTFYELNKCPELFVNIQYRSTNERSAALANKLGTKNEPGRQLSIPTPSGEHIVICTNRAPIEVAVQQTKHISLEDVTQQGFDALLECDGSSSESP